MQPIAGVEVVLNNLNYSVGFIKISYVVGRYFIASLGTTLKMWVNDDGRMYLSLEMLPLTLTRSL